MLETATARVQGASWAPLGRVSRGGSGTFKVDPPDGVSDVLLHLHIPLPSLALITAAFVFTDDRALEPNRLLTEDFSTVLEERGGLRHPEWGKNDLISEMRGRTLAEAGAWLREALHLEGTFGRGALEGHQYPSLEWWTTRRARPFLWQQQDGSSPGYLSALRFDHPANVWEGDAFDGQVLTYGEPFTIPNDEVQLPSYSLVVAGREQDIFASKDMKFFKEGPEEAGSTG